MKRAPIDFAPPSLALACARVSLFGWLLALGAFLALACTGHLVWHMAEQRDAILAQQQDALRQLRRATPAKAAQRAPIPDPQVDAVNRAIAQLNLPWRDLFDAIEATTPANVALLSAEPDARKHMVRGIAEAANSDTMIAYLKILKRHPFFQEAVLTHHEVNDKDPNHPLRFQFELVWQSK